MATAPEQSLRLWWAMKKGVVALLLAAALDLAPGAGAVIDHMPPAEAAEAHPWECCLRFRPSFLSGQTCDLCAVRGLVTFGRAESTPFLFLLCSL